jgi:dipeptidyl aminopeptidase/acylaminoacyl peptidase
MDAEGAVTQATRLTSAPGNIRWAPDGKSIAFTMQVPNTGGGFRGEAQVNALKPRGATWTQTPRVVEKLDYRQDGQGFTATRCSTSLSSRPTAERPPVTTGEWSAAAAEWTPDGKCSSTARDHACLTRIRMARVGRVCRRGGDWHGQAPDDPPGT